MTRGERSRSNDPAVEPAVNPVTRSAIEGSGGGPGRALDVKRTPDGDLVNRSRANPTPRRYEQPLSEDGKEVQEGS